MPLAEPAMIDLEAVTDDLLTKFGSEPGIYVVKSDLAEHQNVFRFGKKRDCVFRRIKKHSRETGKYDNITGDLMPYSGVCVWLLKNWPAHRVDMAELTLFGALKAQDVKPYMSPTRHATDKSNFVLTDSFDWHQFRNRVNNELNLIASLGE